jgi:hypothetical protein
VSSVGYRIQLSPLEKAVEDRRKTGTQTQRIGLCHLCLCLGGTLPLNEHTWENHVAELML